MNVCIVYQDQFPWDVRIEKFYKAMVCNNIKVTLISRNRENLPEKEMNQEGVLIIRTKYLVTKSLNEIFSVPAFFSPLWIYSIYKTVRKNNCSIVIVRDLPLALTGIFIGKLTRIPVVFDMAENYPAMLSDTWKYGKIKLVDKIIRNPKIFKIIEKFAIHLSDQIIVVSNLSKERLENIGVPSRKITIVGNTPEVNKAIECKGLSKKDYSKNHPSPFVLLYVGGLEISRGVQTVIMAMPSLIQYRGDVEFHIVGSGEGVGELRRLVSELNIEKNVKFYGWIPHAEVASIIKKSDVCVIPHFVTEHVNTTLPNKIFEYMLHGKPVIASDSAAMIEIINEGKCGVIFESGSVEKFIEAFKNLTIETKIYEMGNSGKKLVFDKYNWTMEGKKLNVLLENVSIRHGE